MKKLFLFLSLTFIYCLNPIQAQQGLKGDYYNGTNLMQDQWVMSRIDPQIDFDWQMGTSPAYGIKPNIYSIRWTGRLQPPVSGRRTALTSSTPPATWISPLKWNAPCAS